jgi:hypothetical protein
MSDLISLEDAETLLTETVMGTSAPPRLEKFPQVHVEGEADLKVFAELLAVEEEHIKPGNGDGRTGDGQVLLAAEMAIREGLTGFLAIMDADFRRLDNWNPLPNVVLTHGRDLETMIIRSRALDKIVRNWKVQAPPGSGCNIAPATRAESLRNILCMLALPVGRLRYHMRQGCSPVSLQNVPYEQLIEGDPWELNRQAFANWVTEQPQGNGLKEQDLLDLMSDPVPNENMWDMVRGHDMATLLGLYMLRNSRWRHSGLPEEHIAEYLAGEVESLLYLAFGSSRVFHFTELHCHLWDWQNHNTPWKILRSCGMDCWVKSNIRWCEK